MHPFLNLLLTNSTEFNESHNFAASKKALNDLTVNFPESIVILLLLNINENQELLSFGEYEGIV